MKAEDLVEGKEYTHIDYLVCFTFHYITRGGMAIMYHNTTSYEFDPSDLRLITDTVGEGHTDLKDFCEKIIDLSINWTGEDEEKIPALKTIRTLAGYYLNKKK